MVLLLMVSVEVAMWLKMSTIAFKRFTFDTLKSFILAFTNFATASRICAGGSFSEISALSPLNPSI